MERCLYFVDVSFTETTLPKANLYHLAEECLMNNFEEDITGKNGRFYFSSKMNAEAFAKFYKKHKAQSPSS